MTEFQTRSMVLKSQRLPPFPSMLQLGLLVAHYLPTISMFALAAALYFSPQASALQAWIEAQMGIPKEGYAALCFAFAVMSFAWAHFPGILKRVPVLDFAGAAALTFPLLFYIMLTAWYVLRVAPDTTKVGLVLYAIAYITQIALYAVDAGLRLWFRELSKWMVSAPSGRG